MDALIFIDTNILLDFYRIRKSEVSLKYLSLIDGHKDILITGYQVQMEYQKNRQHVILDSLGKFKNPDWSNLSVPALLAEAKEAKLIEGYQKNISTQQSILNTKIEEILKSPLINDPVFKTLQKLFQADSAFNLNKEHSDNQLIKKLAKDRFLQGYPPRKKNDTSIGDAINWEWIIQCAKNSNKNIIVVTRDSDYGVSLKKESFLNDWLKQEFVERTSSSQDILLTDRLSVAFKENHLPVSDDMVEEESRMIQSYSKIYPPEGTDNVTEKIFDILNDMNSKN